MESITWRKPRKMTLHYWTLLLSKPLTLGCPYLLFQMVPFIYAWILGLESRLRSRIFTLNLFAKRPSLGSLVL